VGTPVLFCDKKLFWFPVVGGAGEIHLFADVFSEETSEDFSNCFERVVLDGVGQNFNPSPRKAWKFFGGIKVEQRLWQAKLFGQAEIRKAGERFNCAARL
jgi:hypothetical protein